MERSRAAYEADDTIAKPSIDLAVLNQYDPATAEVLLRREQQPPDLSFLNLRAGARTNERVYTYSPGMAKAIGVNSNRVAKGSSNLGCHTDGGPPWASLPSSLRPAPESVAGADYAYKPPAPVPDFDGQAPLCTVDVVRRRAVAAEMRERSRQHLNELQQRAAETRQQELAEKLRREADDRRKLGLIAETTKTFDRTGAHRRALSAPMPGDSDEDEAYVQARRAAVVHELKPLPKTKADEAEERAVAAQRRMEQSTKAKAALAARGPLTHARDRQRQKHEQLEAARLDAQRRTLTEEGWAPSTVVGGVAKRVPGVGDLPPSGVTEEEHEEMKREVERVLKAKREAEERQVRDAEAALRNLSEPPSMRRHKTSHNNDAEEPVGGSTDASDSLPASPGRSAPRRSSSALPTTTTSYKPIPMYRPELPGAGDPTRIIPLEELRRAKGVQPPPWGVDESCEKDAKQKAPTPQQRKPHVPSNSEITHQLKMIRDRGLQRKPRELRLTAAREALVRALPGGPGQRMQPAAKLPKSSI